MGTSSSPSPSRCQCPSETGMSPSAFFSFLSINRGLDTQRCTHGHISSLFPLRLYHCAHSPWQLSSCKGPALHQHQSLTYGLWWPLCIDTRGTQVYPPFLFSFSFLIINDSDSTKDRFLSTYHVPEITLPSNLPLPLHHHSHPTSSEHLPLPSSQPISASSSLASRDVHLGSPIRRPSHRRSHSHSSPRSSLSKAAGNRPSIHIVGPTPTSSLRGDQGIGNSGSLGPSTLALLGAHTKGKTKDLPFFNATVLELVKLVQIGLSLFGMYGVREDLNCAGGMLLFDGLLCDVTVRGIERWIAEIGEPRAGLEVSLCCNCVMSISLTFTQQACRANSRPNVCVRTSKSCIIHAKQALCLGLLERECTSHLQPYRP